MLSKLAFSGGVIENFITRVSWVSGWRVKYAAVIASTINPNTPAAIHAGSARILRADGGASLAGAGWKPALDASSAKPRSLAV